MDSQKILQRLYPESLLGSFFGNDAKPLWPRFVEWTKKRMWSLVISAAMTIASFAVFVYYYNTLVSMRQNVLTGWAQVEVQLQRRYNIQQNLTQIVTDYSKYEQSLMTRVTELRMSEKDKIDLLEKIEGAGAQAAATSKGPVVAPPTSLWTRAKLDKLFTSIRLVAEQYPQLRLSENFQSFSTALVQVEGQITEQTIAYNNFVNKYNIFKQQFPGNLYAFIYGFDSFSLYTPDRNILEFKPVKF